MFTGRDVKQILKERFDKRATKETWTECDRALVSQIFEVDAHIYLYRNSQIKPQHETQKKVE